MNQVKKDNTDLIFSIYEYSKNCYTKECCIIRNTSRLIWTNV